MTLQRKLEDWLKKVSFALGRNNPRGGKLDCAWMPTQQKHPTDDVSSTNLFSEQ